MSLTREQILASRGDRKPVPFDVPEWGGTVYIKVMSVRDQVELTDGKKPTDVPLLVVLQSVVDENGQRLFLDDDVEWLADEAFPVVLRVFTFAAKLNGLSTAELEEAVASFSPSPDESRSFD